jgi:sec-independent protein translocase protein TatA
MFGFSMQHMMLLGIVVLLLFGSKGKISDIMGDVAKGIKSFKKGMADDPAADAPVAPAPAPVRGLEARAPGSIEVGEKQKAG